MKARLSNRFNWFGLDRSRRFDRFLLQDFCAFPSVS